MRGEPDWLLNWRIDAFKKWQKMKEPNWAEITYPDINYDELNYYNEAKSLDNSDLKKTYDKMGLSESEQKALLGMATDTVIDSRSVHTSYSKELEKLGIIFLPLSEAVQKHPELVKFFGKNSETEIPVAGYINGRFVSRRIDRLVIDHENKLVYILDYKTDIDKSTYHEDYIQQINEYVELLRGIYPQYDIQAFILWLNDFSLEKV